LILTGLSNLGSRDFKPDPDMHPLDAWFLQMKVSWSGPTDIYGISMAVDPLRLEDAT
jgi:hypothetical protein